MKGFCRYIYQFSLWQTIEAAVTTQKQTDFAEPHRLYNFNVQVENKWVFIAMMNTKVRSSFFNTFVSIVLILYLCDSIVATKSAIHLLISHFVWIWIREQAPSTIQFHFETLHRGFQFFIGIVSLIANKSKTFHYWILVGTKNIMNVSKTLPWLA